MNMQNMQAMQNMFTMYNNMKNNRNPIQMVFNPKNANESYKRTLINQNINQARIGTYQGCSKYDCVPVKYISGMNPGKTDKICEVKVIYEHALDLAEQFAEVGVQTFTKKNKMNPVILNVVARDFTGDSIESSEGMRDEMINIRTTFCINSKKKAFPIIENNCAYTPYVNIIRGKNPSQIFPWKFCYRVNLISASPIQQDGPVDKMSSCDYIKTCTIIENVFQIAIGQDHEVLILTPFGHEEDNNPIEDIIQIYNFCIMKYGHKLNKIIIAIPPYYPKNLYIKYLEGIKKPNEIVGEIDKKYEGMYEGLAIQKNIQSKFSQKNKQDYSDEESDDVSEDNEDDNETNENEKNSRNMMQNPQMQNSQMQNPQMQKKFQMFMQMMQNNQNIMKNPKKKK